MKIKISKIIFAIIILFVLAGWLKLFWFTEIFHTHKSNEPHRNALIQIRDAIPLGASYEQVLDAYWKYRTDRLILHKDRPSSWYIRMPLEFGANDWGMQIEFQNNIVSAVLIRTSDGPPPKDGPKDKNERSRQTGGVDRLQRPHTLNVGSRNKWE